MASETYDYVIVGGGTAGCVLASRLSHAGHSVLVLESGPEDYSETIMLAAKAPFVFESPVVQRVFTSPQKHLADRPLFTCAGRLLGGSSSVNQANWTRTHSADYDEWSDLVGDKRWSYSGLLPYFKKVETHYDTSADPAVHGFDGPIHVTAGATKFPLHEPVKQALLQAGLRYIPDINTGNPLGVGPFTENWKDAQRQPAGKAYDLSKATVRTGTSASKVVISSDGRATGVQLADGTTVSASREVLLCAGSIQTPKLLMLSGVGHAAHLKGLDIPVRADLPVGDNLHDHLSSTLYFKLKHPEHGLAAGHPKFDKPEYYAGNPIEWIATCAIDEVGKHAAAHGVPAHDPRVRQERAHTEIFVTYAPLVAPVWFKDGMSMFGSYISSTVLTLLPRSHGTIRLKSTDPGDDPLIDPNYNSHPMDRVGFRQGVRTVLNAMLDTEAGKGFVAEETPPDGMKGLSSKSSDAEIDERFAKTAMGFFQMAGTASMGKVVDTDLKVKGIKGLRVVDASVIPVPLAGHYQCPVYAMAESAADLVLQDAK